MASWIHISDLQIGQGAEADASAVELVRMALATRPDFVIDTGDCVNGAVDDTAAEKERVKELWAGYRKTVRPIWKQCPFFVVPGNHDFTGSNSSNKNFLRQTGRAGKPAYFATNIKGVHLVGLDLVPERHLGGFIVASPQGRWLARHLRRERRARCTVVAGHFPVFAAQIFAERWPTLGYDEKRRSKGDLLPLMERAGVDLFLCGHLHTYERCRRQSLTQIIAGGADIFDLVLRQPPSKFRRLVDIDDRRSFVRFSMQDDTVRGETVGVDGQILDRWSQKLNKSRAR